MSLLPNENCHFSAVNSESGANATSPAAMATASNEPTHFFARSASDFAVRACGFSPPAASQALYPTLEALGLPRHQTGVMKGMSQDRNALHGGKQVHGKAVGVFPLSECPKLALNPGQVFSQYLRRSGCHPPAPLLSLQPNRPNLPPSL